MRNILIAVLMLVSIALFASSADAQKKTPRKTPVKKPPATVIPPLDVRAAREKVEVQLENVNRFVDELGPKADALELLDNAFANKKVSAERRARHESNKKSVILAIRNMKVGLSKLESEFRTKTLLAKYLPSIQGITDLAAASEDLAIAGKFVAAKGPLRDVAQKLNDTLAVLPK